ncbi:MAG: GNAT family protein [Anaerolineae bacterium]|nr:GNAT family protein [Anaerolineae bacterium]
MLEGLLVNLVPYGKEFLERDHRWMNNQASFWSGGGERHFMTQAMIAARHAQWAEESGDINDELGVAFGVQSKDGTPLGYFGINWLSAHHRLAMLGAKIGEPRYWGGGYGTDALLLLLDYTFDWLDVRKAWLMTTSMNARVMRQMEKVGFRLEVRQRQSALADGVWYDWLAYGLLREEWPGRAALVEQLGLRERATAPESGAK